MVVVAPLIELAGLLVALGLIALTVVLVAALFQVADTAVSWVPWLGKKASNGLRVTEKRLNNRLSHYALGVQGAISDSWHLLANLIEQMGDSIWKATQVGAKALWYVEVKYPLDVLSALAHRATNVVHRTVKVTTTQVTRLTKVQGISAKQWRDVLRKLTYLSAALAALRAAVAHAPDIRRLPSPSLPISLKGLRARVGRLERRFGRKAFAASVATALGVLGLSWTRRSCVKRNNDLLCKTDFGALEALLAGAVVVVGSQSVVRFADTVLSAEDEMVGVLERMVVELGALK